MIYYSDTPRWIFPVVENFAREIDSSYTNISSEILNFEDDNIAFIPIYGEEELNDEWLSFFQKISESKNNIDKNLILYFCGVYDFDIKLDLTFIKQIKFLTKFLSLSLSIYPIKLSKDFADLDDMLYFYRHTNPYQKNYNIFSANIKDIIFYSKDFPLIDTKTTIDFTSKNNEYDNILNFENADNREKIIHNIFSQCDRDSLIFNRISNCDLESIISNSENNYIKTLSLKSDKLKKFPDFRKFSNLLTLNLTANFINCFDIERLPISIRSINIGKNCVSSMILSENTNLEKIIIFNNRLKNLDNIEKLSNLKYINFGLNPLDEFPINLLSCKKLEHINMSLNNIKSLPMEITNLENLKILDITRCSYLKNDSVLKKLKNNGVKLIL
ncbi:hypothetical protein R4J17_13005 [Brachyspira intermedia]|uniref:leucine-rich repeat domain-containing protein n=2 Tax=Brachyspira intermedia TaxID=84377 RepID=UPI0030058344